MPHKSGHCVAFLFAVTNTHSIPLRMSSGCSVVIAKHNRTPRRRK
jgi:hypothetical protein